MTHAQVQLSAVISHNSWCLISPHRAQVRLNEAAKLGFRTAVVPAANTGKMMDRGWLEGGDGHRMDIKPCGHVSEALEFALGSRCVGAGRSSSSYHTEQVYHITAAGGQL